MRPHGRRWAAKQPRSRLREKMNTAAKAAKAAGLKNLKEVTALTGISAQTLDKWYKNRPELFNIILMGCKVASKESETECH